MPIHLTGCALLPASSSRASVRSPSPRRRTPHGAAAPTGLHGFLLRADEARTTTFSRTPSFAWNPVAGALRYEFQVSTSSLFRDSGIVHEDDGADEPRRRDPALASRG